jgi:hypothetical protein
LRVLVEWQALVALPGLRSEPVYSQAAQALRVWLPLAPRLSMASE